MFAESIRVIINFQGNMLTVAPGALHPKLSFRKVGEILHASGGVRSSNDFPPDMFSRQFGIPAGLNLLPMTSGGSKNNPKLRNEHSPYDNLACSPRMLIESLCNISDLTRSDPNF